MKLYERRWAFFAGDTYLASETDAASELFIHD
jgi:hypothetical protein